jgi:hypothetical protein
VSRIVWRGRHRWRNGYGRGDRRRSRIGAVLGERRGGSWGRRSCPSFTARTRFRAHRDVGDEAITVAVERLDELLGAPAVANRLAHPPDGALQRRIADELVGPHLLAQLLPGDDALPMCQQVGEDLEHFRPKPDGLPSAVQGIETGVEGTVPKDIEHGWTPRPAASGQRPQRPV